MEGEQERGREVEEKEGDDRRCSKAGAKTEHTMIISVAKKANAFSAGNNRAYSNGGDRKDECSSY